METPASNEDPIIGNIQNENSLTRRNFLTMGTAAIAAPLILPNYIVGCTNQQPPSDKLNIAAIGLSIGSRYLQGCEDENIVALCDLDDAVAARSFERWPNAKRYRDYRRMLDQEGNNIDALIVATPDHMHTTILMAAIGLDKHIYCAKPVTHTIGEARRVKKAILKNKHLVTQTSIQASWSDSTRSTEELLKTGAIGPVREIHIWSNHPIYPTSLARPTEVHTPPPGMDWDLWLGPAPERQFNKAYHPFFWRAWWDFGSGTVGDMLCHTIHGYFDELKLGAPSIIYGNPSFHHDGLLSRVRTPECESSANMVTWEYPARHGLPPLSMHWYDGGMRPHRPVELDHHIDLPVAGVLFVGEKGKLLSGFSGGNVYKDIGNSGGLLLPTDKFRDFQDPPKTLPRVDHHYKAWTQACKTKSRTDCPIGYGCDLSEIGLLGALALRTQKLLRWDAKSMKITNHEDEVNGLIDPPYRKGWEI